MAEIKAESNHYITDDTEENQGLIPDSLGLIVQELYQRGASDSDRKSREEIWESGWHAMRGEFPDTTSKAVDVAKERGIYVNLTKRKVHEARTKLLSSTLQAGKVPLNYLQPAGHDSLHQIYFKHQNLMMKLLTGQRTVSRESGISLMRHFMRMY